MGWREAVGDPERFFRFGPRPRAELDRRLRELDVNPPADLHELWVETGGGVLYQTEYVVSPFATGIANHDFQAVQRRHADEKLAGPIFHHGVFLSVIRPEGGYRLVFIHEPGRPSRIVPSLDGWYDEVCVWLEGVL